MALSCHRLGKAFAGARGSGRPGNGKRQQAGITAQGLQFAPAGRAVREMLLERLLLGARQRANRVEREVFGVLFVRAHCSNTFRNWINPERMRVFTVPSGSPVCCAISV